MLLLQCHWIHEYINGITSNIEIPDRNLSNIDNKQVLSLHITYLVLDNDNNFLLLLLHFLSVS